MALTQNSQFEPLENIVKKEVQNWDKKPVAKLKPGKTISVIISCYNNELTIRPAIESVLRQDIEISEIIVADDGSTDSSRKIISELATKHENVIASFREYNVGVSANRDRAIRSATGELITTLDGDDLFLPGKIKAEYEILAKHEFKGIAYSDILLVTPSGSRKIETGGLNQKSGNEALKNISTRATPVPRDMLFPKSLYVAAGGFDLDLTKYEDWLLKMKISVVSSNTQWLYSGVYGTAYDRRSPGLSQMNSREELVSQLIVLNRLKDNGLSSPEETNISMNRLIDSFEVRDEVKCRINEIRSLIIRNNVEKNLKKLLE